MARVDAVVSYYPIALLEYFLPLNKTLFLVSQVRYENRRWGEQQWKVFNAELIELSKDARHLIGANIVYDPEYITYFTGMTVEYIASFCGYTNVY